MREDTRALLDALQAKINKTPEEQEAQRILEFSLKAAVEEFNARVATEREADPATPWAELGDRVAPGQRVVWTDGETYRNKSGAWLPTSVTPDQAQWWAQETGLPAEVEAWAPGQSVTVNDLREHLGVVYSCLQTHTTQAGWEPPSTPALWSPQG